MSDRQKLMHFLERVQNMVGKTVSWRDRLYLVSSPGVLKRVDVQQAEKEKAA